jgi:hypothetical protein
MAIKEARLSFPEVDASHWDVEGESRQGCPRKFELIAAALSVERNFVNVVIGRQSSFILSSSQEAQHVKHTGQSEGSILR